MHQSTYFQRLETCLSAQRLGAYRRSPHDSRIEVLSRELWNLALCEALYPALQAVEVALRNSIHDSASAIFGSDRWFNLVLPSTGPVLLPDEQRRAAEVTTQLSRRFVTSGRTITAGDIVAGLTFGFWTSLLNAPYERPHLLWPRLLGVVFPKAPRSVRTRRQLHGRLNRIRLLRNRVFHHESVWNRPDLLLEYSAIIETIGWISPESASRIGLIDRFPEVYGLGARPFEQQVAAFYGSLPR